MSPVSYFEWVQDREQFFWTIDEINGRLRSILTNAFNDCQRLRESTRSRYEWAHICWACAA